MPQCLRIYHMQQYHARAGPCAGMVCRDGGWGGVWQWQRLSAGEERTDAALIG
jgi:hypothetical protein